MHCRVQPSRTWDDLLGVPLSCAEFLTTRNHNVTETVCDRAASELDGRSAVVTRNVHGQVPSSRRTTAASYSSPPCWEGEPRLVVHSTEVNPRGGSPAWSQHSLIHGPRRLPFRDHARVSTRPNDFAAGTIAAASMSTTTSHWDLCKNSSMWRAKLWSFGQPRIRRNV